MRCCRLAVEEMFLNAVVAAAGAGAYSPNAVTIRIVTSNTEVKFSSEHFARLSLLHHAPLSKG